MFSDVCKNEGTKGYPTFYLYHQGNKYDEYGQGRTTELFLQYIKNPPPLPAGEESDDLSESREPAAKPARDQNNDKPADSKKKDVKQEL